MPTPARTSDDAILRAARIVLERAGAEAFSLSEVAAAVGVKTPSLYKRITDRAGVLASLERQGFEELALAMRAAASAIDPVRAMALAYRKFAMTSPHLYGRMMAPEATRSDASLEWRQAAIAPVLAALSSRVGERGALASARTVTAFLHGFVMMEQSGAFRLGGSVDDDFHVALSAVLRGVDSMQ
jgi:AcrR family transcriptional regulator